MPFILLAALQAAAAVLIRRLRFRELKTLAKVLIIHMSKN